MKNLSQVLAELKQDYLQKLPTKILQLKALTRARQWRELEEEYHNLKGNGKTYGFPEISAVCEKLEFLAHNSDTQMPAIFDEAITLLESMSRAYALGQSPDLSNDPTFKTLMKMKSLSENQWLQKANLPRKP